MRKLKSVEARINSHRFLFFRLYEVFEEVRKDKPRPYTDTRSLHEIEESLKTQASAPKLRKMFRSQEKYDSLIFEGAVVILLFAMFGPGQVETAWATLVAMVHKSLEEVSNEP